MTKKKLILTDYTIHIGDFVEAFKVFLDEKQYSNIVILCDTNTEKYCLPFWKAPLPAPQKMITIKAGERYKNIRSCEKIWSELLQIKADRNTLLVNLGGGVVGDLGGFVAATYKRGIPFVQIPTTLLAQVDASIGGKVGVDMGFLKNVVGAFALPEAVFIDPVFLKTLHFRQIRSGFAEIIKHAFIADADLWQRIKALDLNKKNKDTIEWYSLIVPSLEVKNSIVTQDFKEQHIRKALNFGHTIGHALETSSLLFDKKPLYHGEAVAYGMIAEMWLSEKAFGIDLSEAKDFLLKMYGNYPIDTDNTDYLIEIMQNDKKNDQNGINFNLLPEIGKVSINHIIEENWIKESLNSLICT